MSKPPARWAVLDERVHIRASGRVLHAPSVKAPIADAPEQEGAMMKADKTVFTSTNPTIVRDPIDNWLYASWSGPQTPDDIMHGGHRMAEAMAAAFAEFGTDKVLNDNLAVIGSWRHSIDWAVHEWFPVMFSSGLKHFAWVLSPDALASLTGFAVASRSGVLAPDAIRTFTTLDEGRDWLRSLRG